MQHNTELFILESNFNSATYTLNHLPTGKSLFFQGDDALMVERRQTAINNGTVSQEMLAELWFNYSDNAN